MTPVCRFRLLSFILKFGFIFLENFQAMSDQINKVLSKPKYSMKSSLELKLSCKTNHPKARFDFTVKVVHWSDIILKEYKMEIWVISETYTPTFLVIFSLKVNTTTFLWLSKKDSHLFFHLHKYFLMLYFHWWPVSASICVHRVSEITKVSEITQNVVHSNMSWYIKNVFIRAALICSGTKIKLHISLHCQEKPPPEIL